MSYEALDLLYRAWGVIANAGFGDDEKSAGWQLAAEQWRDDWHKYLNSQIRGTT